MLNNWKLCRSLKTPEKNTVPVHTLSSAIVATITKA